MKTIMCRWLSLIILLLPLYAFAHKPSDSYLFLMQNAQQQLSLRWDIALRDLEQALGLDANGDGNITWGEVQQQQQAIVAYSLAHLTLSQGQTDCPLHFMSLQIDQHTDGAYAVLNLQSTCSLTAQQGVTIDYRLLFDLDPTHEGILVDKRPQAKPTAWILSATQHQQTLGRLTDTPQASVLLHFIQQGIHHILIGFDHLLFISLLILPAVLVLHQGRWQQVTTFKPALVNLLKVVTAFTVAHSITLSLAVLGVVELPSRLVESAIALSIILVALNILYPLITHDQWKLAFVFGLLHGFGFASVLMDLSLPTGALAQALFGFNVGVELGQLFVILLLFPLVYMLRSQPFYRHAVLQGGAILALCIAGLWFMERAFATNIFF